MENKDKESREKVLIRSGDILNALGILRSAKLNDGTIKKEEFIELLKKNYVFDNENLPSKLIEKLNEIWIRSIDLFAEMGIDNNSTANEIKIKQINIFS